MEQRPTWPQYAMGLAYAAAARSEDPHCKVGAAVLDVDGTTLGTGYNGTIAGRTIDWSNRDRRRELVVHAEANALRHCLPSLRGQPGGILAVTHFPCAPCVLLAASYGITDIFWDLSPDWDRYPPDPTYRVAMAVGTRVRHIARTGPHYNNGIGTATTTTAVVPDDWFNPKWYRP